MPTRQFNGPAGGEYVTDQYGNCLPVITSPITDDYDLAGQIASQDARVTAAESCC